MLTAAWLVGAVFGVLLVLWLVAYLLLHDVPAGQIRLVTWVQGSSRIYRGPAKAKALPLIATSASVSGKPISVELDVTDQTGDTDAGGAPHPVEVRVQATAIASVGDSEALIRTAANRWCAMSDPDQMGTLTNLLASAVREALNQVPHDELFSARATPGAGVSVVELPLAKLTREICAPELAGFGLVLKSFSIKGVHSEVADARRRQAAAAAHAETAIVATLQARRAREAELETDRVISEKEREVEEMRAQNAGLIAQATARQQEIKAKADAERVRIEAEAAKEALRGAQFGLALDEALRITKIAAAQAEGFRKVNDNIREGGDSYFRYRLIEMLPQLTPAIAEALAQAKPPAPGNGSPRKRSRGDKERAESPVGPEPAG